MQSRIPTARCISFLFGLRTTEHRKQADQLTPWSWVLLENLTVLQLVKNIPHILWNPKVPCRIHKSPSLVLILKKFNSIHAVENYFFTMCFNIILPSPLSSSKWSLYVNFPHHNPCTHFCSLFLRAPTASLFWFDLSNNVWWSVWIVRTSLWNLVHSPVTSSL
jgi:hypothetical protein